MKDKPVLNVGKRVILCIGAHPDDSEFRCLGTVAKFRAAGDMVYLLSLTDGSSGHQIMPREEIKERRCKEAAASAAVIGAHSMCMGCPDGLLEPTIENREKLISIIRKLQPDLILTNRLNDYHPDHRYTAQLVQDASYMLIVPNVVPTVPAMRYVPVIMYWGDVFLKPYPFNPDMVVDIDQTLETKITMLTKHESQMFEWLPWAACVSHLVPSSSDLEARREWVRRLYKKRAVPTYADRYRSLLVDRYGEERGASIVECEAFELCEYGYQPTPEELIEMFRGV